jgi:hypothetical protein
MAAGDLDGLVRAHVQQFFAGHDCEEHIWTLGPCEELPHLRVLEFSPGPRTGLWVYVTVGVWRVRDEPQLEFFILGAERDLRHVELLFMTAWYHKHECLGRGHTLPIGEPWLPGSQCEHFLVSLPYPFGPELEICNLPNGHLHCLWLLPITAAERELKVREGLEALEQRFDQCAIEYWDLARTSVV